MGFFSFFEGLLLVDGCAQDALHARLMAIIANK